MITMLYHCVYRITNVIENKHYYGKHSGKIPSELDIGIKYFSSAKGDVGKAFIKDQKTNPHKYFYKIVQKFQTAELALSREIKLHNKFDVAKNEKFYNRAKQTATGFDTTGIKRAADLNIRTGNGLRGVKKSATHRANIAIANSGKPLSVERREKIALAHTGKIHSKEQNLQHSLNIQGENHPNFTGYYITPLFTTAIHKKLAANGMVAMWCKSSHKQINKVSYSKSKYLLSLYTWEFLKDKTFKDIGFGFIPAKEYISGCTD